MRRTPEAKRKFVLAGSETGCRKSQSCPRFVCAGGAEQMGLCHQGRLRKPKAIPVLKAQDTSKSMLVEVNRGIALVDAEWKLTSSILPQDNSLRTTSL